MTPHGAPATERIPAGDIQLSDVAFGRAYNEKLINQVVTAYQAAGRAGTEAQKSRAEVRGGGKKALGAKRVRVRPAPLDSQARFGWAADAPSRPSPAISRRK